MSTAKCPLPRCGSNLHLSVTSDLLVEETVSPVSDVYNRSSVYDYWEVVCENGHTVDVGGRETDGREPVIGLRSAMSLGGLR